MSRTRHNDPSCRHSSCDGWPYASTCENSRCDGCDGCSLTRHNVPQKPLNSPIVTGRTSTTTRHDEISESRPPLTIHLPERVPALNPRAARTLLGILVKLAAKASQDDTTELSDNG